MSIAAWATVGCLAPNPKFVEGCDDEPDPTDLGEVQVGVANEPILGRIGALDASDTFEARWGPGSQSRFAANVDTCAEVDDPDGCRSDIMLCLTATCELGSADGQCTVGAGDVSGCCGPPGTDVTLQGIGCGQQQRISARIELDSQRHECVEYELTYWRNGEP